MRYLKGSINLNLRDKGLLHAVADARYITHSQLFDFARLEALEFKRRDFNWRIRRLVKSGLLRRQVAPYVGIDTLYSITPGGIQALEELGVLFLGGGYVKDGAEPQQVQVSHVLELNRIRLALERSRALVFWIPESLIRVLNLSDTQRYAKTYDAVAKLNLGDGVWAELAIEYERTLKSPERYAQIAEAVDHEQRLNTVLYLCPSHDIVSTLRPYFRCSRRAVLFAQVDDFKKDVLDTEVDMVGSYRRKTLRQVLLDHRQCQESSTRAAALPPH